MNKSIMDKITLKLPKIIFPDVPGDIEVETFDKYEELLDNLSAAFQYWSMERNSQTEFSGGFLYSDMSEKEMDLHGFIFVIRNKGKITYKKAFIFLPLGIMDV